jgi:hypothetical protein
LGENRISHEKPLQRRGGTPPLWSGMKGSELSPDIVKILRGGNVVVTALTPIP